MPDGCCSSSAQGSVGQSSRRQVVDSSSPSPVGAIGRSSLHRSGCSCDGGGGRVRRMFANLFMRALGHLCGLISGCRYWRRLSRHRFFFLSSQLSLEFLIRTHTQVKLYTHIRIYTKEENQLAFPRGTLPWQPQVLHLFCLSPHGLHSLTQLKQPVQHAHTKALYNERCLEKCLEK